MANMQAYLLVAVMLLAPAVQVYGRRLASNPSVVPHELERKPIEIPTKLTDKFPDTGNFAKVKKGADVKQSKRASGNSEVSGFGYGDRTDGVTTTTGDADAQLDTQGNGHGTARATGHVGGFARFGKAKSGGAVEGVSRSTKNGVSDGDLYAEGFAVDRPDSQSTGAEVDLEGTTSAEGGGPVTEARIKGDGVAGGKVTHPTTVSGLKGSIRGHSQKRADSESSVEGETYAEEGVDEDASSADGHLGTTLTSASNGGQATGSATLHGGSKAGKTETREELKATGKAVGKDGFADGDAEAAGLSVDTKYGPKTSHASSEADSEVKETQHSGARAKGEATADTEVKNASGAFSESKTSGVTGSLRVASPSPGGTKAWAGGKHVAAIKNGHGLVTATGTASAHASKGHGVSSADGFADAVKDG